MNDITTRAREMTAALCAALEVAEAERDALRAEMLRHMRERDALRADVERLRARKAERCSRRILWDDGCCPKWCAECGGSGAVIVEEGK